MLMSYVRMIHFPAALVVVEASRAATMSELMGRRHIWYFGSKKESGDV